MSTFTKRRYYPIEVAEYEPYEATVDTDAGLVTVTLKNDWFETHYANERITDDTPEGIVRQVNDRFAKAERARERARRRNSGATVTGLLFRDGDFEEVQVRGVHKTSGDFLVTRADGDKDQARGVLRGDLTEQDRADLVALYNTWQRAKAQLRALGPRDFEEVLAERGYGEVDLTARYDPATGERVTEFEGREFRAARARMLADLVVGHLLADMWAEDHGDPIPAPEVRLLRRVWPSREAVVAFLAVRTEADRAHQAFQAARTEYALDKSEVED